MHLASGLEGRRVLLPNGGRRFSIVTGMGASTRSARKRCFSPAIPLKHLARRLPNAALLCLALMPIVSANGMVKVPEGLKKNLRRRDGRWYWHWDPKFLTAPADDAFVREEKLERAAIDLTIPILLIRGKLSDVVSPEGVKDFLAKVPQAEFVELSDAGHTAAGDDNDAFSEAVVQFVSR